MFVLKLVNAVVLKAAVAAIASINGADTATFEFLPNLMLIRVVHPTQNLLAIVKMKSSGFHHYTCNRAYFVNVNVRDFSCILNRALEDDFVTISCQDPTAEIFFKFENQGSRKIRHRSIPASETSNAHWTTDESAYQYRLGLSSPAFRDKFMHLKLFGDTVQVTLSETKATLKTGLENFILTKEDGECMIQGIDKDTIRKLRIPLAHLEAFAKASYLTPNVWIYDSTNIPPLRPVISCPLLNYGSIRFYLPPPFHYFSPVE